MGGMQIGLHALGIGPGADPGVIGAVGRTAERCGFATLWAGEHVVMVDRPDSVYPYADDGRIAVPSDADWLDPLALFAFLAATTSRIRLATGVLLLPEHNPLIVAKHAASVDVLSGGRLTLGVGIGWSAEEYAALGVPFRGREARNREYVEAMRLLWKDDRSSYTGEYVQFEQVRCYPKPVQRPIPIVLGGNGARALDRVRARRRRLVRLQSDARRTARAPRDAWGSVPTARPRTRCYELPPSSATPHRRTSRTSPPSDSPSSSSSSPHPRRPTTPRPGWRTWPAGGASKPEPRPDGAAQTTRSATSMLPRVALLYGHTSCAALTTFSAWS